MDQRAKKLEKKRKSRDQAKKKASVLAARGPSNLERLARSAAREEFGPCFVSAGWDGLDVPALVSVVVTRKLSSGQLMAGVALVDRTCLGIKDGFTREPMSIRELEAFVEEIGGAHGGMLKCEPRLAQSVVFHAIDYARSLGFEPHRDFPSALFGPRPMELLSTPWSAPDQPIYVSGPRDNVPAIVDRLAKAVGAGRFEHIDPLALADDDDDDLGSHDGEYGLLDEDVVVHSPLECTVNRDGTTLQIFIYRGRSDVVWHLEIEDHLGGSTVWDEQFETDRMALDAALLAIEQDGIESFLIRAAADTEAGVRDNV